MHRVALITDTTAGLSAELAAEFGISVAPASFAFEEQRHLDGALDWATMYDQMAASGVAPRTFGVTEAAFRTAMTTALQTHESVFCLVAPFDVNPSFTTACAAMLAIQFDAPEARIKVANAGLGSAGLGALLVSLAELAARGAGIPELVEALDEMEPRSDSLFVPADPGWLRSSGRLNAIEDRLGGLDGLTPVVRVGTRITGVVLAEDFEAAVDAAVAAVGRRAGDAQLNAIVVHAHAPDFAAAVAEKVRHSWDVRKIDVAPLAATHGSQLGPGTIGIGVCPAISSGRNASA